MSGKAKIEKQESKRSGGQAPMTISVDANGKTVVFQLNDSTAAQQLYAQLPLDIKVEDYGSNEKIFYPPKKLDTADTPKANAKAGTLAYYAPWGDVVMFYKNFGSAAGLYELGYAVSGDENIKLLSGTAGIEKGQ
nr:cyclophilin-like fold protein [uncultured Desulfobacter sp.]